MTKKEAIAEAKRQWPRGDVRVNKHEHFKRYTVGYVSNVLPIGDGPDWFVVKGTGATWEDAFADAASKAIKEK